MVLKVGYDAAGARGRVVVMFTVLAGNDPGRLDMAAAVEFGMKSKSGDSNCEMPY